MKKLGLLAVLIVSVLLVLSVAHAATTDKDTGKTSKTTKSAAAPTKTAPTKTTPASGTDKGKSFTTTTSGKSAATGKSTSASNELFRPSSQQTATLRNKLSGSDSSQNSSQVLDIQPAEDSTNCQPTHELYYRVSQLGYEVEAALGEIYMQDV
ncbi:MAG: hypothetical protein AABX60_03300, partial [Nanoarchaeota archaeon]